LVFLYSAPVVAYHVLYMLREAAPLTFARWWNPESESVGLGTLLCAILLQAGSPTPFIYFQF
jgi:hypothetical protein